MRKGQTALEYLMTYGWAILIVIIAVGALYGLGLTKPCRWVGTQVSGFSGGGFAVETPKFDASDATLVFDLKRIGATTANVTGGTAVFKTTTGTWSPPEYTATTGNVTVATFSPFPGTTSSDCYSAEVTINYKEGGRTFTAGGKVSGTIEA